MPDNSTVATRPPAQEVRRVAAASCVGTTIEWYDFFIYATATALIFNAQFFPTDDPTTGTLLAFATFGIGFLARPLGGIVAGHFGDRLGRKAMLITTLVLMGAATTGIGLLPTYATIGIAAPILLVALRLVQGFSAGGEWAGAALIAVEHAPVRRRGLWGSAAQVGVPMGLILANVVFLGVQMSITREQFNAWGWRIPFLLSIVLVGVGLYIRLRVSESPVFTALTRTRGQARTPLVQMMRRHRRDVLVATLSFIANNAVGYIFLAFLLSYGTTVLKVDRGTMLLVVIAGSAVWFASIILGGHWSDRFGRRRLHLIGYGILIVWAVPFFALLDTRNTTLMILATAGLTIGSGLAYGPQPALFAEMFDVEVRYSGASTSFALGAVLGGAFAPLIATALVAVTGTSYSVSAYMALLALISFAATLAIREGKLSQARDADAEMAAQPT